MDDFKLDITVLEDQANELLLLDRQDPGALELDLMELFHNYEGETEYEDFLADEALHDCLDKYRNDMYFIATTIIDMIGDEEAYVIALAHLLKDPDALKRYQDEREHHSTKLS